MTARPSILCQTARGFTLVEILIAIFILGVVLTTVYAAYSGTLRVIRELDDESLIYKMGRMTLDRMSRDICAAQRSGSAFVFQSEKKTFGRNEFNTLFVWSAGHLVFDEDELSGQPASIAYFVKEEKDGSFSLWRSDVAGPKPSMEKKSEGGLIICQNLQALNLKFYDESGKDYDVWDTQASIEQQKGKPPMFVQIELVMENARDTEKPYKFKTKVFLPVRK
jgi:prepilin-type N-terminal cleavage/methylation domain-containing protein